MQFIGYISRRGGTGKCVLCGKILGKRESRGKSEKGRGRESQEDLYGRLEQMDKR